MSIRELTPPANIRNRKSKYPFTEQEVKQSIVMLKKGTHPGDGPFDGDKALQEARSAAQSLVRHIVAYDPDLAGKLSTKAWLDEKGEGHFLLSLRD